MQWTGGIHIDKPRSLGNYGGRSRRGASFHPGQDAKAPGLVPHQQVAFIEATQRQQIELPESRKVSAGISTGREGADDQRNPKPNPMLNGASVGVRVRPALPLK